MQPVGVFTHFKGGFYHDGRFKDLTPWLAHYNSSMKPGLTAGEQSDVVQYLLSLTSDRPNRQAIDPAPAGDAGWPGSAFEPVHAPGRAVMPGKQRVGGLVIADPFRLGIPHDLVLHSVGDVTQQAG
jgi:hypothetical protein